MGLKGKGQDIHTSPQLQSIPTQPEIASGFILLDSILLQLEGEIKMEDQTFLALSAGVSVQTD